MVMAFKRHRRALLLIFLALCAAVAVVKRLTARGPVGQRIVATLRSANGLIAGADVRAGGVKVGRVESVGLGPGDLPRVAFRLDEDYVMRRGGTVDLRLASQAGQLNRYLAVTRGRGAALPDGARLGTRWTDEPVELDDALSLLTPSVRAQVQRITASADRALKGHAGDLAATVRRSDALLRRTAALLHDVSGDGRALRTLVDRGHALVAELARDPDGLQRTAGALSTTLATTTRRQEDLGASTEQLPGALRAARTALERFDAAVPDLRALARDAAPAARELRATAPALAGTLTAAPATLGEAKTLMDVTPDRMATLRPLVRAAKPVLEQVPGTLTQFGPVLDQLRAKAPDALGWLPLLGDALGNYDANGHAARLELILGQPPQTAVGPDDLAAGLLEKPFARTPGVLEGQPWKDYESSYLFPKSKAGGGGGG